MISAAALLDAIGVIKVVVSLAAGLVWVGQEVFPAALTCALCCLCLPELGCWRLLWLCSLGLTWGHSHRGHVVLRDPPWWGHCYFLHLSSNFRSSSERKHNTSCKQRGCVGLDPSCTRLSHWTPQCLPRSGPRGHGRLLPGVSFGLPKCVPGSGQAEQAADWHFDQQESLGECSNILNST